MDTTATIKTWRKAAGLHIGQLLGKSVVAEARRRKAGNLFLEVNTALTASVGQFHKLDFGKAKCQRPALADATYSWN